jgi:hypothetical protein
MGGTMRCLGKIRSYLWSGIWVLAVSSILSMLVSSGCTDSQEYDPYDPLDPPPGPPELIYPLPDTNLCGGLYQNVFFDWNIVGGAEMYEVQTDSTLTWTTAVISQSPSPPIFISLHRYSRRAVYYARIRAASSGWTNYTAWSDPRRFYLRPDP